MVCGALRGKGMVGDEPQLCEWMPIPAGTHEL